MPNDTTQTFDDILRAYYPRDRVAQEVLSRSHLLERLAEHQIKLGEDKVVSNKIKSVTNCQTDLIRAGFETDEFEDVKYENGKKVVYEVIIAKRVKPERKVLAKEKWVNPRRGFVAEPPVIQTATASDAGNPELWGTMTFPAPDANEDDHLIYNYTSGTAACAANEDFTW